MKKSTAKAATPVSLGTKRTCPKCGVKFYDFNKKELNCPKCAVELDEATLAQVAKIPLKAEKKEKPAPAVVAEDEADSGPGFESVDDLGGDDDVEDIEVVEDKDDEEY